MQKHPEDGKKPDINCCFQDLRKQPSLLLSRANSGWCCQPYNPALTFYPPPCNTSLSRKEKAFSSSSYSLWDAFPSFLLFIKRRWEKNSEVDTLWNVHGRVKCTVTTFVGYRQSESRGFASVSVPLQTSGQLLQLDKWSSIRAGLDMCCLKEL